MLCVWYPETVCGHVEKGFNSCSNMSDAIFVINVWIKDCTSETIHIVPHGGNGFKAWLNLFGFNDLCNTNSRILALYETLFALLFSPTFLTKYSIACMEWQPRYQNLQPAHFISIIVRACLEMWPETRKLRGQQRHYVGHISHSEWQHKHKCAVKHIFIKPKLSNCWILLKSQCIHRIWLEKKLTSRNI